MDIRKFNERIEWKPGSQIHADADKAMEVMNNLREKKGLSPQSLLDASRPEGSVLHGEFEWDDTVAAEAYRLRQAGHIIRSIVIVHEKAPEAAQQKTERVISRAFFPTHDTDDERRGTYESVTVIASSADMKARLMQDCLKELRWMQNKYSALKEVIEMLNPPIQLLQAAIEEKDAG